MVPERGGGERRAGWQRHREGLIALLGRSARCGRLRRKCAPQRGRDKIGASGRQQAPGARGQQVRHEIQARVVCACLKLPAVWGGWGGKHANESCWRRRGGGHALVTDRAQPPPPRRRRRLTRAKPKNGGAKVGRSDAPRWPRGRGVGGKVAARQAAREQRWRGGGVRRERWVRRRRCREGEQ